jgi:hypothetical protein
LYPRYITPTDPLSIMIQFGTPNLQMIDLINLTINCLLILTTGVAFGHFVNLSTAMYRWPWEWS